MGRDRIPPAATRVGRAGVGCLAYLALGVLALGLVVLLVDRIRAAVDPVERSARAAELWRAEQLAGDTYHAELVAAWAWRLAPALAATVLLCGLSVVIVVVVWRQFAAWQTLRLNRMIAFERARQQRFPVGLQTLAVHDSSRAAPMLAPPLWGNEEGDEDEEEGRQSEHTAPPFEALLSEFGPGRPRVLGRDLVTGELVRLPVEELFNIGLGGTSGAGKSWTATALAAQHILAGGKLLVIDPHGRKPDGLTRRLAPFAPAFFCKPAIDLPDVAAVVKMVRNEVQKRKSGRPGRPWLVVVDEYAALMRSSIADDVGAMVEELGQEGRGFGVTALVSSQVWNGTRAGGSEVRDALASHIIHRLRPAQARMLTGLPADALPADLYTLPRGVFYLMDGGGELRRVAAPLMSDAAVTRVAAMLTPAVPQLESGPEPGPGRVVAAADDDTARASERSTPRDAETVRLLARFADGASVHELASELAGTDNTGARAYKLARGRVEAMLRALVVGGGV